MNLQVGALIIRIEFGGPLYCDRKKAPPKLNSIGNNEGPYTTGGAVAMLEFPHQALDKQGPDCETPTYYPNFATEIKG